MIFLSLDKSEIFSIGELVDYQDKSVVSVEIVKKDTGTVTLFAFDEGEGLSEHSAPFDAIVQVIDGTLKLTLDGVPFVLNEGDLIIMPADVPHALHAETRFKMILTMIKS